MAASWPVSNDNLVEGRLRSGHRAGWAQRHLVPGSQFLSDGLARLSPVATTPTTCRSSAGSTLCWGNLMTSFISTFHAFNFDNCATRNLGCFFRFNQRFLIAEMTGLIANVLCCCMPYAERDLRVAEARGQLKCFINLLLAVYGCQ